MEEQNYEFKSQEEVPEFLDGYVDRDMIEQQPKTSLFILKVLKFFGNVLTFGHFSRVENKKRMMKVLEQMNADNDKADNKSASSGENMVSKTTEITIPSKKEMDMLNAAQAEVAAAQDKTSEESSMAETKVSEQEKTKTEENLQEESSLEENSLEENSQESQME